MEKLITVRALESFTVHNHDKTEVLGEVEKGEVLLATFTKRLENTSQKTDATEKSMLEK